MVAQRQIDSYAAQSEEGEGREGEREVHVDSVHLHVHVLVCKPVYEIMLTQACTHTHAE